MTTESYSHALSAFLPPLLYETMASTRAIGGNGEIRCDILIVDDNASSHAPKPAKLIPIIPQSSVTPKMSNTDLRKRLSLSLSPPCANNKERRWSSKACNEKSPRRLSLPSRTSDGPAVIMHRQTRSFEDHILFDDSPISPHLDVVQRKSNDELPCPSKGTERKTLRHRVAALPLALKELPFPTDLH